LLFKGNTNIKDGMETKKEIVIEKERKASNRPKGKKQEK
jgi:hypothetical protein